MIGVRNVVPIEALNPSVGADGKHAMRPVWFAGQWLETPIYRREHLFANQEFAGPAIVEQLDATTVVEPQDRARVDVHGNIIIEIGKVGRDERA